MITPSQTQEQWLRSSETAHGHIKIKEAKQRGRPYLYPTSVLIRCYLMMLLFPHLRCHASLHRYLSGHPEVCRLVGLERLPHRTTFSRRFKSLGTPLRRRIWAMGCTFILAGLVELHIVMADGTLHRAAGPEWPHTYQERGEIPGHLRHLDTYAGWGHSPYHRWVYGYRTHPVVALTADLQPVPLLADAHPANVQDNTILAEQLPWLPEEASVMVLDSNYEDHKLVDAWQRTAADGILERWMVIEPKKRSGQPASWRQRLEVTRLIEEEPLYKLRGQRIEPFFSHWKAAFDLDRLPLQGRDAPVYLLLAMYGFQLLIWMNWHAGRGLYAHQHLILGLD